MNAKEYRAHVAAKRCIDCLGAVRADSKLVRCDDCNGAHRLESRIRYGAHTYACTSCREVGHNRRRCPLLTMPTAVAA